MVMVVAVLVLVIVWDLASMDGQVRDIFEAELEINLVDQFIIMQHHLVERRAVYFLFTFTLKLLITVEAAREEIRHRLK